MAKQGCAALLCTQRRTAACLIACLRIMMQRGCAVCRSFPLSRSLKPVEIRIKKAL